MCQLTSHTGSIQVNLFQYTLSPRQSSWQVSVPLSINTSCKPLPCYFSLLFSPFHHCLFDCLCIVLYCLLLLSLTILVIQPLGCKRDINKLLLLLLLVCIIIEAESDASQRSRRFLDLASNELPLWSFRWFCSFQGTIRCRHVAFEHFKLVLQLTRITPQSTCIVMCIQIKAWNEIYICWWQFLWLCFGFYPNL